MMANSKLEGSRPPPLPSRNPLPLSASQEAQVRELYHKNVRTICDDVIRGEFLQGLCNVRDWRTDIMQDFAACATNRTISATWACRQQRLTMNGCMVKHATQRMQDEAREEWFANMELRKRERDEKAKQKIEAEAFNKEWWKKED